MSSVRFFRSTLFDPQARGVEFGFVHAQQIKANITLYQELFHARGAIKANILAAGETALASTKSFAPALHAEMLGLAEGAAVEPALIGMLNARTEILAQARASTRGECSVVIHEASGTAIQTWDWFYNLRNGWLVWEIPHADGSTTKTMTEYGIVGKSGLNTKGLGLLFTILHHKEDGKTIGLPVHIAARWVLDQATTIAEAKQLLQQAKVSASSSINLVAYDGETTSALTAELHPGGPSFVKPNTNGTLIHTNHFLNAIPSADDTEPQAFPDTLDRYNLLHSKLSAMSTINPQAVLQVMANHDGKENALCCHHNPHNPTDAYETLSTVVLDVKNGILAVHAGGPCTHTANLPS